jgi:hypothetical protein
MLAPLVTAQDTNMVDTTTTMQMRRRTKKRNIQLLHMTMKMEEWS